MTSNGNYPDDMLRVLPGFLPYGASNNFRAVTSANLSDQVLATIYTDAANMAADFERDMHQPLTYAEAYRPLEVQQWRADEHAHGGPNAAVPGFSNHGLALALDYRNGIGNGPGSTTYEWMRDHAGEYGFVEDVSGEHWHWHHPSATSVTNPRNTEAAGTGDRTPIEEDDMPYTPQQLQTIVSGEIAKQLAGDGFQKAVTRVLPDALQAALPKVTAVYDDANGRHTTSLADWLKDVRNKVFGK